MASSPWTPSSLAAERLAARRGRQYWASRPAGWKLAVRVETWARHIASGGSAFEAEDRAGDRTLGPTKPRWAQAYKYTGRQLDGETATAGNPLYYYRARYYDPATGRFAGRDPVEVRGVPNLYAYVRNRPLRFRDPFGTQDEGTKAPPDEWNTEERLKGKGGPKLHFYLAAVECTVWDFLDRRGTRSQAEKEEARQRIVSLATTARNLWVGQAGINLTFDDPAVSIFERDMLPRMQRIKMEDFNLAASLMGSSGLARPGGFVPIIFTDGVEQSMGGGRTNTVMATATHSAVLINREAHDKYDDVVAHEIGHIFFGPSNVSDLSQRANRDGTIMSHYRASWLFGTIGRRLVLDEDQRSHARMWMAGEWDWRNEGK